MFFSYFLPPSHWRGWSEQLGGSLAIVMAQGYAFTKRYSLDVCVLHLSDLRDFLTSPTFQQWDSSPALPLLSSYSSSVKHFSNPCRCVLSFNTVVTKQYTWAGSGHLWLETFSIFTAELIQFSFCHLLDGLQECATLFLLTFSPHSTKPTRIFNTYHFLSQHIPSDPSIAKNLDLHKTEPILFPSHSIVSHFEQFKVLSPKSTYIPNSDLKYIFYFQAKKKEENLEHITKERISCHQLFWHTWIWWHILRYLRFEG